MNSSPALPVCVCLLFASFAFDAHGEISVQDDLQNWVKIATPAKRIISLAPHLTEMLFSLEVGAQLVGTSRHSDYPRAALDIPIIGDAFTVNVEAVVDLQPDIIFAWSTGGANRALERLGKLGVTLYLNEAKTIKGIGRTIVAMAELVGKRERGRYLQQQLERRIMGLRKANAQLPRVRVFFQISDQDLYTVNKHHLIGQAITVCNGENVFAEEAIAVPLVSKESIVMTDPDIIVISKPVKGSVSPWEKRWSSFGGFGEKLRWIDPGLISRPSLRMVAGIELLCELIHR